MHVHVFNDPAGADAPLTLAGWRKAGIAGRISFGISAADFHKVAATVDVLVTPGWGVETFQLSQAPRLLLVQCIAAGVDNLLRLNVIPAHVPLANGSGLHAEKAGEYALMAILMLVNRVPQFIMDQRACRWARLTGNLASAKRLTIVGIGSLGGAAARQARRLGMHVTGIRAGADAHPDCDVTLPATALDTVLPKTDILLLACPLTAATNGLLSASRIALLPPGAGVINIGRGRLIDQPALFDALEQRRLSGAVLDVLALEPPPPDDRAWTTANLIITPHMSSDDPASFEAGIWAILAGNLAAMAAGQAPPTLVDRARGY